MPLLEPNDFRAGSFDASCSGLLLSDDEANDLRLTSIIEAVTQRVSDICDDYFESTGQTIDIDVVGAATRLYLPRRTTSANAVSIRDHTGGLRVQDPSVYRLRSSLDPNGAIALYDTDYLEVLPYSGGISGGDIFYPYVWPQGTEVVQVEGNFGWIVTPGDVKRVVALLTWDIFKREAGDVRRASRWARGDLTVERATDTITGLPEADDLLRPYIRSGGSGADEPLVLIG